MTFLAFVGLLTLVLLGIGVTLVAVCFIAEGVDAIRHHKRVRVECDALRQEVVDLTVANAKLQSRLAECSAYRGSGPPADEDADEDRGSTATFAA